ncbi:hypothetical protein [Streptomyces drozdowiczii]|uniref:hypothetical protein n=1 Tax=Streptomyces drozdowiczii TaxID=202862 RepID=UPI00403C731D
MGLGRGADTAQLGLGADEFGLRRADELRSEGEPVGERVRLLVQVVDLFPRCLQRFPDPLQSTVLGVKEVIDRALQVGSVLGGPDPVSDLEKFRSGGVGPQGVYWRARASRVERGRKLDVVAGGAEHLSRVSGDGDLVGEGRGGGKAMTSAVPVVDLLEAGVLEERGGKVVAGALRRDTAAGLGGNGDGGNGHGAFQGAGNRVRSGERVVQLGGDAVEFGMDSEGVVEAAVLTNEGGHHV